MDSVLALFPKIERLNSRDGRQHRITAALQEIADEQAHGLFVFHDQNDFIAPRQLRDRRRGFLFCGNVPGRRQMDAKRRPFAHLAVHFNPTAVLLDDGIHSGESQAGSLADFLGGEEGFENMPRDSRGRCRSRCHSRSSKHTGRERRRDSAVRIPGRWSLTRSRSPTARQPTLRPAHSPPGSGELVQSCRRPQKTRGRTGLYSDRRVMSSPRMR